MSARVAFWSAAALAGMAAALAVSMSAQSPAPPDTTFLAQYCQSCHDTSQRAGGLVLAGMDVTRVEQNAPRWEAVVRRLRDGSMPPPGRPRADAQTLHTFVAAVEEQLDRAYVRAPAPGRPVLHRLNRAEYGNAIRDLLALEVATDTLLPSDATLDGFDNMGGVLSMSPALMDRYLLAARRISRQAVGDPSIDASFASATYTAPQDVWQQERISEALPFGSRGGMAIRHHFPLAGEYTARLRLRRNILGYVRGLARSHELEVRIDGERVEGFVVGGESLGEPAPQSFTGVIPGSPQWEARAVRADEGLVVRFNALAGTRTVAVYFEEELYEDEGVQQPRLAGLGWSYDESRTSPHGPAGPAIESVSIDGPYSAATAMDTPSRQRIFSCRPRDGEAAEACARAIVATLAARAYRRPATDAEIDVLLGFYRSGADRRGFEEGVRAALERLLIDPNFLFRVEPDAAPGAPAPISDLALASRLSFFLWSSIPDDELRDLAAAGRLRSPGVLVAQVDRLRTDERASALVDNFVTQWLSLRQLRAHVPDPELYIEFDGNLRQAFEEETKRFVADQIRADRSVMDLIAADYTFLNERLARHYGVPGVHGTPFRRVTLPRSATGGRHPRGGLLGHGSILTLTSYPTRTSPVLRGRWLLDTVFGTPPAPPPPDIPPLPAARDGNTASVRSVRERTERHRSNPVCASCHQRMDPLGFALENFDAIGRWRGADESGVGVDASASLPDGAQFAGIEGLRAYVLARPEEFARAVTARLLTYALGRALESSDAPAVRRIVREAAPGGYRWSSLIHGVIASAPFQLKASAS